MLILVRINNLYSRLEDEILKRTTAEAELEESKLKLDAMWLSVSEMEAEAVRLRTNEAREETARLAYEEAKKRLGLTDPDLELGSQGTSEELSDRAGPAEESLEEASKSSNKVEESKEKPSVVKNVVTELFDEVLQQKKIPPASPRQELTNLLQDSIKDPALRTCLTSIISPVEEDEDKYNTLDREPQPGHDSEIDSYLGEDQPGEFDTFFGYIQFNI